jgi:hypothetical protein
MGFDAVGVEDGFVAQAGGEENLGFENERDELFRAAPLDEAFPALIDMNPAIGGFGGIAGVRDGDGVTKPVLVMNSVTERV